MRSESNKYATFRNLLLTGGAASALSLGLAPAAFAQAAGTVEKVTVTGTRIPQKNLITTSPVTQVTAADVDTQGVTRIEDLTNQLPQVFAAQSSTVSNGATGTAEVNLRGLGAQRTLVLINGRRMPYGSPFSSSADVNQIPGQLVDRVEVLTGGASSVYGSDAVAGVVNFIMRKDFEGFQVDAQYGYFSHHNDFEGPGIIPLRQVILNRAATNPSQFQLPQDDVNDGIGKEITGVLGASSADGKGNITAYASYRSNDQILQRDRDFSACSLGTGATGNPPVARTSFVCGGSGTSASGTFDNFGLPNATNPFGLGNFHFYTFDDPATPDDESGAGTGLTVATGPAAFRRAVTADQYNFGPLNYFQRPDERYSLGAMAHYQIDEQVEVYTELMFTDYRTVAQIAPSGDFFDTSSINCDNPLLSTQQRQIICDGFVLDNSPAAGAQFGLGLGADGVVGDNVAGPDGIFGDDPLTLLVDESEDDTPWNFDNRPCLDPDLGTPGNQCVAPLFVGRRNVEGGGRLDDLHYESYRIAGGFRGEVVTGWDYDLALLYSKTQLNRSLGNYLSVTRMRRALNVVNTGPDGILVDDPATLVNEAADNAPICQSVLDGTDAACVPYNIFAAGGVTQAQLNYLTLPLTQQAATTQRVATFTINGDLGTLGMKSPWAESPLQTAFGAEFRRDELDSITDVAFQTADGGGQGGPTLPISGDTDVSDYFVELQIPLMEDQQFAHQITIDLAYRYSDYDTGITTDTWKIGADWAPTEDIRFRGSQQRAVRAANVIELFTAQGFNLFDLNADPCGDGGTASAAACIGDPTTQSWKVTPAQFGSAGLLSPAGQYNFLQGGNPNLTPEVADTKTLGLVFTPTFIKNLVLSVDWFEIEIADTITTIGADVTLEACYEKGILSACQRIKRNPGTGQLWIGTGNVVDLNTNIGGLKTTGIDINANYKFDLDDLSLDGAGGMSFQLIGTYLDELVKDPGSGATPFDCKGFYSGPCANSLGNGPTPEWRHRFRATWATPWDADLSVTWRHVGGVALFQPDAPNRLDAEFDAEDYFDVAAMIELPLNSRLRLGVNNVMDNDPPISASVGTTGNGNTYPQTYDSNGRWVFMGISVDM